MPYSRSATGITPAHIIYLIDVSGSMVKPLDKKPKIDHINTAIKRSLRHMIQRSITGDIVAPRYKILMIAYSDNPMMVTDGFAGIDEFAKSGRFPELIATNGTNTRAAFCAAYEILQELLPQIPDHPAPMVCHLTDGRFAEETGDPEPIAKEIMALSNEDGNVLVENIFVDTNLTIEPIVNIKAWPGITGVSQLSDVYAKKLFSMSSILPESYAREIWKENFSLSERCTMIFPCANKELIELAFTASAATKL